MAFDSRFIDELKMNINIVDVVGREVSLKKSGSSYKGLCPFHSEKTPSFIVNEEKQIYNCFGCGEKGDVIRFVQRYYGLDFLDSVDKLCDEYGIKKPERGGGRSIDYEKYYDINAEAARFFFSKMTEGPNPGYTYIRGRGISDSIISKFGLGYAPDDFTSLTKHLLSKGVSGKDMIKLGLAAEGRRGLYDKFRNRVMFPIFNTQGKVIGFGGRALGDAKPKYLNSPESEIFLKKNNLYALNFTKKDIADAGFAILVEGYMDAISLYQNGVRNVAASLGTALTDNQAKLIGRYSKNIVLSYDSDDAGIKAALRGVGVMRNAGHSVKVLSVTDGKDPDEFIKARGKEAFLGLVADASAGTAFILESEKRKYDLNTDIGVISYISGITPILKSLSPVEQDIYVKKLAGEFNISESSILAEIHTDSAGGINRNERMRSFERNRRYNQTLDDSDVRIELSLAVLAMNNTRYLKNYEQDGIAFRSGLSRKIMAVIKALDDGQENGMHSIEMERILEKLDPEEESVFRKFCKITRIGPDDEAFYKECRAGCKVSMLKQRRLEILSDISVAEKIGNVQDVAKLGSELIELDNLIKETMEGKNA